MGLGMGVEGLRGLGDLGRSGLGAQVLSTCTHKYMGGCMILFVRARSIRAILLATPAGTLILATCHDIYIYICIHEYYLGFRVKGD